MIVDGTFAVAFLVPGEKDDSMKTIDEWIDTLPTKGWGDWRSLRILHPETDIYCCPLTYAFGRPVSDWAECAQDAGISYSTARRILHAADGITNDNNGELLEPELREKLLAHCGRTAA